MSLLYRLAFVGLLYLYPPAMDGDLQVIEDSLQVWHRDGRLEIDLPIAHSSPQPLQASVEIELLAPDGTARHRLDRTVRLETYPKPFILHLALLLSDSEWDEETWSTDRLHYRLRAADSAVEGTLALSRAFRDNFVLRVAAQQISAAGGRVHFWASALHPATRRAAEGVLIEVGRQLDAAQPVQYLTQGLTGSDGTVSFELEASEDSEDTDEEFVVRASRNGLVREVESYVYLDQGRPRIYITSDKSLYRPGQTLHLRLLALNASGNAWADGEFFARLLCGQKQIFSQSTTANAMGIAALDWEIPDNIEPGSCRVIVDPADYDWEEYATGEIEIQQYELPSFAVEVEPDRPYYLPGEVAQVRVRATRLSGEPVRAAQVRITGEANGWIYAAPKEEMSPLPLAEGVLDEAGVFIAVFDVGADIRWELAGYQRFQDLGFTAHVTDELTGRTEQRRFELRSSRDPIHIYLETNQPFEGVRESYATTFYPDGTPAQCRVRVYAADPATGAAPLAEAETNRYGAAELALAVPGASDIYLTAEDGDGRRCLRQDTLDERGPLQLRLRASKAVYRSGDPLQIEIEAAPPSPSVFLDIYRDRTLLLTRKVVLAEGKATLEIPFQEAFSGFVRINAHTPEAAFDEWHQSGHSETRLVAYPRNGLEVEVLTDEAYRPGQAASAEFRVTDRGRPVKSALGAVIVDQSIQELVRSRREQQRSYFYDQEQDWLNEDPLQPLALFGVAVEDLDFSRTLSEDIQLTARAAYFTEGDSSIRQFSSSDSAPNYPREFAAHFKSQEARLSQALREAGELRLDGQRQDADLEHLVARGGLTFSDLRDPWGNPYRAACTGGLMLTSTGADETADSRDDFVAIRVQWPYYDQVLQEIRTAAEDYQERMVRPLLETEALKKALQRRGASIGDLLDPCGAPLRPALTVYRQQAQLSLESAGDDGLFDTADDYQAAYVNWFYFEPLGRRMTRAVQRHHQQTGSLLWDAEALRRALLTEVSFFEDLRDPWGNPYRLDVKVENFNHVVSLVSSGPDGRFETAGERPNDDFVAWKTETDCFERERGQIVEALNRYQTRNGKAPSNLEEAQAALLAFGLGPQSLLDPWDRPFRMVWEDADETFDSFLYPSRTVYGGRPQQRLEPVKVSRKSSHLFLHSNGQDGVEGNQDDFDAVRLYLVLEDRNPPGADSEESARWSSPEIHERVRGAGAISGTVMDTSGAVIPGAEITAFHQVSNWYRMAVSNDMGRYRFGGLPPGTYRVRIWMPGFRTFEVVEVPVSDSVDTPLDATLEVGEISETVMVSSGVDSLVDVEMATLTSNRNGGLILPVTPRLRSYFPETLAWAPWLETDQEGRARMDFTVADSITSWELTVMASTADGRIRTAHTHFRSFQPFYIQPDPPPLLTVGDEIELPVAVHNYLDGAQNVALAMDPADWFEPLSPLSQALELAAGDAVASGFPVRALRAVSDASQRVTAISDSSSDAVEKHLQILPAGREIEATYSRLLDAPSVIGVTVPEDSVAGTVQAHLKIYPDIVSHAFDGIEGIVRRPFGCAEQTISSTYPNLFVMRALRAGSSESPAFNEAVKQLEKGYRRLQGYRAPQGGFSYWGGPTPAVPEVSLHAWKFLNDARQWIAVDQEVQDSTLKWLLEQQSEDGSWANDADMTGLVARTLGSDHSNEVASAVRRAVGYLTARIESMGQDDPYLLASFLLSVLRSDPEQVPTGDLRQAALRLIASARRQESSVYWLPLSPTPFKGWGTAGTIETTAVALQALRLFAAGAPQEDSTAKEALGLIGGAVNFLLLNKDSFGVWHTTQATVTALDALAEVGADGQSPELEITINGERLPNRIRPSSNLMGPVQLDLSQSFAKGANRVEIRPIRSGGGLAHLVVRSVRPWPRERSEEASGPDLRFRVSYVRTRLRLGENVTCSVSARSISPPGRRTGMMLAEIGLPPGVDVDRSSLKQEMERQPRRFSFFEVRPDRLVVYLWASPGEAVDFSFRFRPRLVMRASAAPSQLYDYYNPDARLDLAPAVFTVER